MENLSPLRSLTMDRRRASIVCLRSMFWTRINVHPATMVNGYHSTISSHCCGLTHTWKARNSWRGLSSMRRSEEHTSELQSPDHLVCRLLLEKKKHSIEKTSSQQSGRRPPRDRSSWRPAACRRTSCGVRVVSSRRWRMSDTNNLPAWSARTQL